MTTTSSNKLVLITERDLTVMRFIGTGGLATLSQIKVMFWRESLGTCRNRLSLLVGAGYLSRHVVKDSTRQSVQVYSLTKTAIRLFNPLEAKFFYKGLPARHEVSQQLTAQAFRVQVEKELATEDKRLVIWRNEHELRSKAHHAGRIRLAKLAGIPDAQMVVVDKNGVASETNIEIDGYYYGQMLDEKVAQLAKSGKAGLWVTTSPIRASRVSRILQASGANQISVRTVYW